MNKKIKELGEISPFQYSYAILETTGTNLAPSFNSCAACGDTPAPSDGVYIVTAASDSYDPSTHVTSEELVVCKYCAESVDDLEKFIPLIDVKIGENNVN